MKVIIDRFEGGYAIVELPDKSFEAIPKTLLPEAIEGDILTIEIDKNETARIKKSIMAKYKNLWNE